MNNEKTESYVHGRENNPDSQNHLEGKEPHFNKQCLLILSLFKQGKVLTQKICMVEYDIGDARRRISELRAGGITGITDEWILDKDGKTTQCKKWFMPEFAKNIEVVYKKGKKNSSDYSSEIIKTTKKKVTTPTNIQPLF